MLPQPKPVSSPPCVCKAYQIEDTAVDVLKEINLTVNEGQFVAVYGPCGAGKSTLLNMISGIDKPTTGKITVFDLDLSQQNEDVLADYRCNKVGFVFQNYNLISTLTVAENIAFPMEWKRTPLQEIQKQVAELTKTFGLP